MMFCLYSVVGENTTWEKIYSVTTTAKQDFSPENWHFPWVNPTLGPVFRMGNLTIWPDSRGGDFIGVVISGEWFQGESYSTKAAYHYDKFSVVWCQMLSWKWKSLNLLWIWIWLILGPDVEWCCDLLYSKIIVLFYWSIYNLCLPFSKPEN